jgi:predicted metalloprotease
VKWRRGKRSGDLEDRRASTGGGGGLGGLGGGGFPIPIGRGGGGIGTILIVLVVYFVFIKGCGGEGGTGFDIPAPPSAQAPAQGSGSGSIPQAQDPDNELVDFVDFVFGDVQDFWAQQFQESGNGYKRAKLVLFRDQVASGCGQATSATGPFYCPVDQKAYVDLAFFDELNRRFKAPGDFAQAYVLAHELGHHVQQQLGIEEEVRKKTQDNPDDANELSVRLELQADCLAGVWAHSVYERGMLESGDLEEGLTAASSVGDDRIQEQAGGRIDPETFTHGTAEQRSHWLDTGFESGEQEACDTFGVDNP